jgi:hypothetical protein
MSLESKEGTISGYIQEERGPSAVSRQLPSNAVLPSARDKVVRFPYITY